MATNEPLKPCPSQVRGDHAVTIIRGVQDTWVACACGFAGPRRSSDEDAVEAWDANRRPAAIPTVEGLDDAVRSAMVDVERIARENPRDSDSWGRGATHIANLAMPIVNALIARLASSTGAQAEEAKPLAPDGLIGKMPEFLRHAETRDLEALIVHCWVHSGYRDCGREQMGEAERILYDDIISRAEQISALPKPEARPEGDGGHWRLLRTAWVRCKVCGERGMRQEIFTDSSEEEFPIIYCTNHACGSNGGLNFSAALRSPGAGDKPCDYCQHWPHPDAQPREWDAETIKDAPEDARYMVRAADTQLWSWELYTKRVTTDWLWVGGMAGRVVCDRAFGPIPYPGGAE